MEDVPVTYSDLGWLIVDRYEQKMTFADDVTGGGDAAVSEGKGDSTGATPSTGNDASVVAGGGSEPPPVTLQDLVDDTDSACREETKDMYRNENKIAMLDGTSTGVPESLQTWLTEVRQGEGDSYSSTNLLIYLSTHLPIY